jgi:perosamine synthetase
MAMELAMHAAGVKPGKEVILAAYDYPGTARSVERLGATPVWVGTEPQRWTIATDDVEKAITGQTVAVVASHLHGQHADVGRLRSLTDAAGCLLIEDACQAIGGSIDGKPVGSFGHFSTFSFGPGKLLSAGAGGAVLTDDPHRWQRVRIASHRATDATPLSPLQACVLIPQLDHLPLWHQQRRMAAVGLFHWFDRLHEGRARQSPQFKPIAYLSRDHDAALYRIGWWMASSQDRQRLIELLLPQGVPVGIGFPAMSHRVRRTGRMVGNVDETLAIADRTCTLEHPALLAPADVLKALQDCFDSALTSE